MGGRAGSDDADVADGLDRAYKRIYLQGPDCAVEYYQNPTSLKIVSAEYQSNTPFLTLFAIKPKKECLIALRKNLKPRLHYTLTEIFVKTFWAFCTVRQYYRNCTILSSSRSFSTTIVPYLQLQYCDLLQNQQEPQEQKMQELTG